MEQILWSFSVIHLYLGIPRLAFQMPSGILSLWQLQQSVFKHPEGFFLKEPNLTLEQGHLSFFIAITVQCWSIHTECSSLMPTKKNSGVVHWQQFLSKRIGLAAIILLAEKFLILSLINSFLRGPIVITIDHWLNLSKYVVLLRR